MSEAFLFSIRENKFEIKPICVDAFIHTLVVYEVCESKSALPSANDLETVPKANVAISLDNATKKTQKGKYQKIKHSKHLLEKIDPAIVMARCPHFARFHKKLGELASQE